MRRLLALILVLLAAGLAAQDLPRVLAVSGGVEVTYLGGDMSVDNPVTKEQALRFRVKNVGTEDIKSFGMNVIFYDESGKPFFEVVTVPLYRSEAFKPNYSHIHNLPQAFLDYYDFDIERYVPDQITVEILNVVTK